MVYPKYIVGLVFSAVVIFILVEFVLIKYGGAAVPVPSIPRDVISFGSSDKTLNYLILGDSTTVGQGTDYKDSYAYRTSEYLAGRNYRVNLINVGVSGATTRDVLQGQLPQTKDFKADVILLSVGANDVTHLTKRIDFKNDLEQVINQLKSSNPDALIVVTGVPAMGSVSRFPWPVRQLAGLRTSQLSNVYEQIIQENNLILAPIAAETGVVFAKNPDKYFAQDKFHPNSEGYGLWTEVITKTFEQRLYL